MKKIITEGLFLVYAGTYWEFLAGDMLDSLSKNDLALSLFVFTTLHMKVFQGKYFGDTNSRLISKV